MDKSFAITNGKGFQIKFDNDVVVSVQFGGGNYCENYNYSIGEERKNNFFSCDNAEVAVFREGKRGWLTKTVFSDTFHKKIDNDVVGHQTPEDVLKILNTASKI